MTERGRRVHVSWTVDRALVPVVLGALVLSGCGGGSAGDPVGGAVPTSSAPVTPALPSSELPPSATPSASGSPGVVPSLSPTGPRTVAQLEAQVVFTAPTPTDPEQVAALAAYKKFVTDFVVLGGLPDPNYPPALAGITPALREAGVKGARDVIARGEVVLGRYGEKVKTVTGGQTGVFITTCIDYRDRQLYKVSDGTPTKGVGNGKLAPVLVQMTKTGAVWQVAASDRSDAVTCP